MTYQQTQELREQLLAEFLQGKISFGRYREHTWAFVLEENPSYIIWADENVEWLNLPIEIVTQAATNKSAKERTQDLVPADRGWDLLDGYYEEEGFYDPYDCLSFGDLQ